MLTEAAHSEIRDRARNGETRREPAARFGVSRAQITRIVNHGRARVGRVLGSGSLVNLDVLPDLFAEAEARGQPIVFVTPVEPDPATRRLMAALSVEVVVTVVSAHELTQTRDCVHAGCTDDALKGLDHCRAHAPIAQPQSHRIVTPKRHETWTQDTIVAALKQWAADHDGEPPTANEWERAGEGHPNCSMIVKRIGSFSRALELAGFSPRPRGAQAGNQSRTGFEKRPRAAKAVGSPRVRWTLPMAIEAVQAFALAHGRTPRSVEQGRKNGLPSLPFAFGGGWGDLLQAAGFVRHQQAKTSGRAAAGQEPTAPVEEHASAPPDINSAASRELEPVGADIEVAARPDEPAIPAGMKDALLEPASVEIVSNPDGGGSLLDRLGITGAFSRDADRVRAKAAELRAQASALDVIATGIDLLAETNS